MSGPDQPMSEPRMLTTLKELHETRQLLENYTHRLEDMLGRFRGNVPEVAGTQIDKAKSEDGSYHRLTNVTEELQNNANRIGAALSELESYI